jgi:hypothetical protein
MHSTWIRGWALVALAGIGCGGVDQDEFVGLYTDHYCEAWLDCGVSATQQFDGIDSLEECKALEGEALTAGWQGCKYKKRRAKQCLESLLPATCPENGDLATVFPPICNEVWVDCVPGAEGTVEGE